MNHGCTGREIEALPECEIPLGKSLAGFFIVKPCHFYAQVLWKTFAQPILQVTLSSVC